MEVRAQFSIFKRWSDILPLCFQGGKWIFIFLTLLKMDIPIKPLGWVVGLYSIFRDITLYRYQNLGGENLIFLLRFDPLIIKLFKKPIG